MIRIPKRAPLWVKARHAAAVAFNWWQGKHPIAFAGERIDDAVRAALYFAALGKPFPRVAKKPEGPTPKGDSWE